MRISHPDHGPAVGVGELLVGVVRASPMAIIGDLGHAVAVHRAAAADLALHLVVQLGRLGRAAARHEAQRRQDRLAGLLALLGRGTRCRRRCCPPTIVTPCLRKTIERLGAARTPRSARRGTRCVSMADEVVGSADVRVRERDRADVVGDHVDARRPCPSRRRSASGRCGARPWGRPCSRTCSRSSGPAPRRRGARPGAAAASPGRPRGARRRRR